MIKRAHAAFVVSTLVGACGALQACSNDDATPGGTSTHDASTSGDGSTVPLSDAAPVSDAAPDSADSSSQQPTGPVGLVYAGHYNNIDQRTPTVTFGSDGSILGYNAGDAEAPFVTTAVVDGVYSDEFAGASRWTNGNIDGPFYAQGGVKPIPINDGQHLGIAKIPAILPASGTATYVLAAATKPTLLDGKVGEGAITSASLTAQFAGNDGTKIGYSFVITMPDGTSTAVANGGPSAVGDAGSTFSAVDGGFRFSNHSLSVTTPSANCAPDAGECPNTGTTRVVFAGPNVERIILSYVVGSGAIGTNRSGVIVFRRQ